MLWGIHILQYSVARDIFFKGVQPVDWKIHKSWLVWIKFLKCWYMFSIPERFIKLCFLGRQYTVLENMLRLFVFKKVI